MKARHPRLADFVGKSEGRQLEFKAAAALRDPLAIPRAVCSFLNTEGGDVVIGLRDDGRTPDPIQDIEREKRRVEDLLASSITPSMPPAVQIDELEDGPLIVVHVPRSAGKGRLFAVRSSQGRFLVPRRLGARTIPMEWNEIAARLRDAESVADAPETAILAALDGWATEREREAPALLESGGLYLVLRTSGDDTAPDPTSLQSVREELRKLLRDPSPLGCQLGDGGFWDMSGEVQTRTARGLAKSGMLLRSGHAREGYRVLEIVEESARELRFGTRIDAGFVWGQSFDAIRKSKLLHPYAVVQTVSSCCRLFAHLLKTAGARPEVISAGLDIRHLRGRRLPPRTPHPGIGYFEDPRWPPAVEDLGPVAVTEFPGEVLLRAPDTIAYRLLQHLYVRSGWRTDDVPFYDVGRERFIYG